MLVIDLYAGLLVALEADFAELIACSAAHISSENLSAPISVGRFSQQLETLNYHCFEYKPNLGRIGTFCTWIWWRLDGCVAFEQSYEAWKGAGFGNGGLILLFDGQQPQNEAGFLLHFLTTAMMTVYQANSK